MDERKEKSFFKRNWKKIAVITLVVGGITASVFGVKKLIDSLPVDMYTQEWLQSLSKEALDAEREKERLAFCASGSNYSEATRHQHNLYALDRELYRRRPKAPDGPTIHREHGWYLPNDD